jgi:hypothetical protein
MNQREEHYQRVQRSNDRLTRELDHHRVRVFRTALLRTSADCTSYKCRLHGRYLSSRSSTSSRPSGLIVTMPVAVLHSTVLALCSRSSTRR